MRVLPFDHLDYPDRLRNDLLRPEKIWVAGELVRRSVHVAIVGAREATPAALGYAHTLAGAVARAGGIVISGGARGIDGAAHRGAMDAGGVTWAVRPSGLKHAVPGEHAGLFEQIVKSGGATLSTHPPNVSNPRGLFHGRNRMLVSLSDVVVIVQARMVSGTRNTARWARDLNRPLWAVPCAPWLLEEEGFDGCAEEIRLGARPLWSTKKFLEAVGLVSPGPSDAPLRVRDNENENKVLQCIGTNGVHVDEIVLATGLAVGAVMTALLTMALEDVVVEARERWYRRN